VGNLYASLLQALACSPAVVHQVSLVAGVAVSDAICAVAGEKRISGLRLKWPNDVLIGEAKCAGILAESQMGDRRPEVVAVIGIGINLVSHPSDPRRATTSLAAHGVEATPAHVLAALAHSMQHWLGVWDNGAGFARVRAAWLERGGKEGESLAVDTGKEKIAGTFLDLDADGALLMQDGHGARRRVTFGDVTLIGERG
jgi:BirA family biotin operon repressor/biotin-[acetyl-CoA-carboxylase] ligase